MRARILIGARVWMQAELAWSILSVLVMYAKHNPGFPQTVTYGELAKLMGYDKPGAAHTLSRPLALIGDLCLKSNMPPLNVIVVSKETKAPGAELLLRPGSTVEADQAAVMEVNWLGWHAPSGNTFRTLWEERNGAAGGADGHEGDA